MLYAYVSEKIKKGWRRWRAGTIWLGVLNFARPIISALGFSFCFLFFIIYQLMLGGSVVTRYACNLQDLGSSPRSGKISMLFFNMRSNALLMSRTTMVHHHPTTTCPRRSNQRRGSQEHNKLQSMHHMESWKVNGFKAWWAKSPGLYLTIWGYTPPWFAFFIFFFLPLFLLFYLFYCLNLINLSFTKYKNIIKIRKDQKK